MKKIVLKSFSKTELKAFMYDIHEKSFRADQVWSWLYSRNRSQFNEMTNISKSLRLKLDRVARIGGLKQIDQAESPQSGTRKYLFELDDGLRIETVYIPEKKRRTVCISTQVGCKLGCRICATAGMGFIRNLYTDEMVNQVLAVRQAVDEKLTNIVVMGMGEPFLNMDHLLKALYIIKDSDGIAIGHRKITISTAGLVPEIRRYTAERHPFLLAISLHATTDTQRNRIMPINKKYPIAELIAAARDYTKQMDKRLTFEYVLIKDFNDTPEDAVRLLELLKGIPCKVNLIACNPTSAQTVRPDEDRIRRFAEEIEPLLAPITLRLSKGDDINGACGQLAVRQ